MVSRYGIEPPVLVKLEKEIELEETLLNTSGPEDSISIPKSCCQHEELHEAVSNHSIFSLNYDMSKSHSLPQVMFHLKENVSYSEHTPVLISSPW